MINPAIYGGDWKQPYPRFKPFKAFQKLRTPIMLQYKKEDLIRSYLCSREPGSGSLIAGIQYIVDNIRVFNINNLKNSLCMLARSIDRDPPACTPVYNALKPFNTVIKGFWIIKHIHIF